MANVTCLGHVGLTLTPDIPETPIILNNFFLLKESSLPSTEENTTPLVGLLQKQPASGSSGFYLSSLALAFMTLHLWALRGLRCQSMARSYLTKPPQQDLSVPMGKTFLSKGSHCAADELSGLRMGTFPGSRFVVETQ